MPQLTLTLHENGDRVRLKSGGQVVWLRIVHRSSRRVVRLAIEAPADVQIARDSILLPSERYEATQAVAPRRKYP